MLETGSLSAFLYHGLVERGVPAVCICARHAKGVLSARVGYFHVAFTLQAEVADIAFHNKALVYDLLFKAA